MSSAGINSFVYLQGKCHNMHCDYNEEGYCRLNPCRLNDEQAEWVMDKFLISETFICMDARLNDDKCPCCGNYLEQRKEYRGEFWGAPSFETVWQCPNCD